MASNGPESPLLPVAEWKWRNVSKTLLMCDSCGAIVEQFERNLLFPWSATFQCCQTTWLVCLDCDHAQQRKFSMQDAHQHNKLHIGANQTPPVGEVTPPIMKTPAESPTSVRLMQASENATSFSTAARGIEEARFDSCRKTKRGSDTMENTIVTVSPSKRTKESIPSGVTLFDARFGGIMVPSKCPKSLLANPDFSQFDTSAQRQFFAKNLFQ